MVQNEPTRAPFNEVRDEVGCASLNSSRRSAPEEQRNVVAKAVQMKISSRTAHRSARVMAVMAKGTKVAPLSRPHQA